VNFSRRRFEPKERAAFGQHVQQPVGTLTHVTDPLGTAGDVQDDLFLSADKFLLFMGFRELKPATTPHRVGTRRFSSSVQFSTTVSPAVSAWVPVLGA
jgi:hypothetical protein